MIIKKYVADTVEEAQGLMRQELGPTATILTSRYVRQKGIRALFAPDKVEITASVDEEKLRAHTSRSMGLEQSSERSGESLDDSLTRLKQMLSTSAVQGAEEEEAALVGAGAVKMSAGQETHSASSNGSGVYGDPRFGRRASSTPTTSTTARREASGNWTSGTSSQTARTTGGRGEDDDLELARRKLDAMRRRSRPQQAASAANTTSNDFEKLKEKLTRQFAETSEQAATPTQTQSADTDSLRQMIREELARSATPSTETMGEPGTAAHFLINKGVDGGIARTIERNLEAQFGPIDLHSKSPERAKKLNALKTELTKRLSTTGPILLTPGKTTLVALVGPTGVGKTTTISKIAAQYKNELGKKVAIISLDTSKVGAGEQVKGLASRLGVPAVVVEDEYQLQGAVRSFDHVDLCLIDTSGCSQYVAQSIDALATTLASVDEVQTHLVVSATTKDVDIYGTWESFSSLEPQGVVVTKLDETIAQGILVNICDKCGASLSYLTNGQGGSGHLTIADPETIAKSILIQNNTREYQRLQRMVQH